jgi:hypothetical protein
MNSLRTLAGAVAVLALCAVTTFALCTSDAFAAASPEVPARAQTADGLKDTYARIRDQLEGSPYGRPLWLDSHERDGELEGDAYAVIGQPFAKVAAALGPVGGWCGVLMLPFNVKDCSTAAGGDRSNLTLTVGPKGDSPEAAAFRLEFQYALAARTHDYLEARLKAPTGPLGTRDYRLVLQAAPMDATHTLIHLGYGYAYGMLGKAAMRAYLATVGASKVGFSKEEGNLVGGMRGVMERNTMRYYLAIDAYLASLDAPAGSRLVQRLNDWFSAAERYPRQLGEGIGRAQYIAMKLRSSAS